MTPIAPSDIELAPFAERHLETVYPWFDDPETADRLGGRDWPWGLLKFSERDPDRRIGLLALDRDDAVALVDLEVIDDSTVEVALVVAPERRRQGLARAIAAALERLPVAQGRTIQAHVHAEHAASRALAAASGFEEAGTEGEGFIRYRRSEVPAGG